MKTEQAIKLLHRLQDEQFDGEYGDERREALEMAVRALFSQQIVNDSQGLVNDCISRKMAIDAFEPTHYKDWYTPTIIETLEALPSAQPQRKKGKWIDNDKINFPQCSECGMWIDVMQQSGEMNFCPNCGADMRGENNE